MNKMPAVDLKRYENVKLAKPKKKSVRITDILDRDISIGGKELSDRKKESLYLELSSLLVAGINLKRSLELVIADQENEKDRSWCSDIQESVLSGSSLSKAFERIGKFSLYEIFSIQIGEETGKLTEVLQELAKFYKHKISQRRKIISALSYPCVVLMTSFGAVFFMMKFVVPMFGDVFLRFGGHLPWITEKIIGISQVFEFNFFRFLMLLLLFGICIIYVRKSENFRRISSGFLLSIPVAGALVQKIYLARFCNCMRLLITAHLPLLRAIALTRQMIGYFPIESSLKKAEEEITKGTQLYSSLQQFKIYPSKLIQLVKVGEETNQLGYFFAKISEQYVEEVEYKTSMLSSTMEPLIIIFLGLIVGIILVSMYLPLFQMSNSFQ